MKKFLFLIALIIQLVINAQVINVDDVNRFAIIGGNGEGLFKNYNPKQDSASHAKLGKKLYASRFPGGAEAKDSELDVSRVGAGKQFDYLKWWYGTYKADENGTSLITDAEIRNVVAADQLEPQSELIDLVQYCKSHPNFLVIFNVNIYSHKYYGQPAIDRQVNAIRYLLNNSVPIEGIVLGNEIYFVLPNFAEYQSHFVPVLNAMNANFPDITCGLVVAPDYTSNREHIAWNDAVFAYVKSNPTKVKAVDTHLYYKKAMINDADGLFAQLLPSKTIVFSQANQKSTILEQVFDAFIAGYQENDLVHKEYAQYVVDALGPDVQLWQSEFGAIPSETFSNSVASGGFTWRMLCKNAKYYDFYLPQQLQGGSYWGYMSKAGARDINPDRKDNLERVQFWALEMSQESRCDHYGTGQYTLKLGDNFICYDNFGDLITPDLIVPSGLQIKSIVHRFVHGTYSYSTAGKTGIQDKTSIATRDVTGIETTFSTAILANSFGYIKIITEKIIVEIPGCTDPNANNYNPNATVNDGSCKYDIYGCMDPKAENYNPDATIDDGSCIMPCVIESPGFCKRWGWLYKKKCCRK